MAASPTATTRPVTVGPVADGHAPECRQFYLAKSRAGKQPVIVRDRTPELFQALGREPPVNPLPPGAHPGGQHEPPPTTDYTPMS